MVQVKSTIGDANFQNPQNPRQRNYVVSDEALPRGGQAPQQPQQPREISPSVAAGLRKQALERQEEAENRALQEARRRIEIITGLGRRTRDVPIETDEGNLTFTLRTLKTFEQNCLAQVVESVDRVTLSNGNVTFTPTSMHKIKTEALSHSLFLVDGQSVDVVLGTANLEYEEQVAARKDLVREMDGALIDYLFLQYEELAKEAYDGYAPKTAEEAKEVVDTVRKSSTDA
jgi:hypothetical protein